MYEQLVEYRKNNKVIGKYHNKFLDDMLLGILSEDFILIGSDTGVGKSEFACSLAFENSLDKNVHLFALEADMHEPYYRKLYKIISKEYFDNIPTFDHERVDMNYRNYIANQINVDELENKALKELKKYSKLSVHYRGHGFTVDDFVKKINEIINGDGCELLIIDHIDYFDLNLAQNENVQVGEIMKVLRQINQIHKIPIVVVSHMRKKINKKQVMPSVDDFFGTSNKAKQVKTIIIMAREYELSKIKDGKYSTLFQVPKLRIGGGENFVGRIIYDRNKNIYKDEYDLCHLKNYGEATELIDKEDYPKWAT